MKLRLRYNKTTAVISTEEESTNLAQLKGIAVEKFCGLGVDCCFSLNGRDILEGENTELSEFGIVSGDLIHVLRPSNHAHENGSANETVRTVQVSGDVSSRLVSGGSKSEPEKQKSEQTEPVSEMETAFGTSSGTIGASRQTDSPETEAELMEAAYREEQPRSEAELKEISRCLAEPMLCRESSDSAVPHSLVEVYRNSEVSSPSEAMCAVMHVLMLETGFTAKVTKDRSEGGGESSLSLPAGWRAAGSYRLTYEHPACEGSYCNLVVVPLGSQVMLHGGVVGGEAQSPVQAQFRPADYVRDIQPDVTKVYCNLTKLSRLFKDGIALPLLHNIHAATGSCTHQGFSGLSTEIKLLILRYLDVTSLSKLGAVSKSFNTLVRDPWLWRRKYLFHWPKRDDNSLNQNWFELYRAEYKRRKELRERLRRMTPVLPHHPFFSGVPPFPGIGPVAPYGGGIIGGDFDLNPNFGFADPLFPGTGRRIFPDRAPHPLQPRFDPMGPNPDIDLPFGAAHAPSRGFRFGRGRHFGGMQPRFL